MAESVIQANALVRWPLTRLVALLLAWPIGAAAMGPGAPFAPPKLVAAVAAPASSAAAFDSHGSLLPSVAVAAPVLTGIRRGQIARALIDGQWLAIGERVGDKQLLSIDSLQVTLQGKDGRREVLALTSTAPTTAVVAAATSANDSKQKVATP